MKGPDLSRLIWCRYRERERELIYTHDWFSIHMHHHQHVKVDMAEGIHVVVLPWLAFGHMIPFLQLSIALAKTGIRVSFISTPKNIQRLPKVPSNLASLINLVEIPLPRVDGLPEGAEATVDIPLEDNQYLKKAYDLLRRPVEQFIAKESPNWIVQDFIPYWTAEIAREMGVPIVFYSIFAAALLAFLGPAESLIGDERRKVWPTPDSLLSPPEWFTFPSSVAFRKHEANDIFNGFFGSNASNISDADRMGLTLQSCEFVAIKSCLECEKEFFELLRVLYKKPVIPVGVLPPAPPGESGAATRECPEVFKWLDGKDPKSVVFVGFGSEYRLSREQVYEIANGLELSNLPFLWALRRPIWAIDDVDALPSGFKIRTNDRGFVCMSWIPQMEILAHQALGGSLIHCGWGSITETLQNGLTLIALPMIIDQGLNAKLLVEKGLALEVKINEDGSFSGDAIASTLRQAMIEEKGEKVRVQARKMKSVFGNRCLQENYVKRFSELLLGYKAK